MKNNTLKSLIDKLNKKPMRENIFLRPIGSNVKYAKVWLGKVRPSDSIVTPGPYEFYFIANEHGFYIGLVLDMYSDLHWFVSPVFRKKGYLTKALTEAILPHLFQKDNRGIQRITIDKGFLGLKSFLASEKVALKIGFKKNEGNEGEYLLSSEAFSNHDVINGENTNLSEERIKVLTKRVSYIARSLLLIQNEVEMAMGDLDYGDELKDLVWEIKRHCVLLENKWYDMNRND